MLKFSTAAWLLAVCLPLRAGEIALSFDDAPRPDSALMSGMERSERLVAALAEAQVKGAIFFAIGSRVDTQGDERLRRYQQAGHFIANHSHTHGFPHELGLEAYVADIAAADAVLRPYPGFINLYRFPYLNEGRDEALRDGIRAALIERDYRHGYVTVDNYDWYMEALLQRALEQGRPVNYGKLGALYVKLLLDAVNFYDAIAQATMGRSPRHVLLLHENDLAALFVGQLVMALRRQGWSIIDGQQAYQDPIANVVTDTLFNGQGRVAAIAEMQGVPRRELIHEAEDEAWLEQAFADAGVFGEATPAVKTDPR